MGKAPRPGLRRISAGGSGGEAVTAASSHARNGECVDRLLKARERGGMTAHAFTVNGEPVVVGDGQPHLLAALRDELGVLSPKDGCSPSGQCGCCTVLLDGKAV